MYLYDQVMIVMREEDPVDNIEYCLIMNSLAKVQVTLRPWGKG
jgi:hypothetical protein